MIKFYETEADALENDPDKAFAISDTNVFMSNFAEDVTDNTGVLRGCGIIRRFLDDVTLPDVTTSYGTGVISYKFGSGEAEVAPNTAGGRLNPVQVSAGMFTSYVSLAALDQDILAYVIGNLRCGWANEPMIVRCGATIPPGPTEAITGGKKGPEVDEAGGYWYKDSTGHKTYSPIVIDEEQFFSEESPGHANLLALLLGYAQLDCFYYDKVEGGAPCPVKKREDSGIVTIRSESSATTEPAEAISYISREDALEKAKLLSSASSLCLFTNNATQPDPCPAGTTTLNMPDGCYDFEDQEVVDGCREPGVVESEINSTQATYELRALLNSERLCMPPASLQVATAQFGSNNLCPLEIYYEYSPGGAASEITMRPGTVVGGNSTVFLGPADVSGFAVPSGSTPRYIALEVQLVPRSIVVRNENGDDTYHVLGVDSILSHEVILFQSPFPPPTRASVNPENGTVTSNGTYYILMASYFKDGDNYVMNSCVCGTLVLSLGPNGELWMQKSA